MSLENIKNLNRKFIQLVVDAREIVDSELDWKTKFNVVFSDNIDGEIHDTIKDLEIELDWHDPDCGYQEDVMSYVLALEEKADELRKLV